MKKFQGTGDRCMRLGFLLVGAAVAAGASDPQLDKAHNLYQLTEFDQSLKVLHEIVTKDAAVYELMGQNYYGRADYKKATEALEKALALDPGSSEINLWLGRAYGRRAETSNPLSAPGHAGRARQYFEKSARLNPNNLDAQSDLFEYYLEAPGFLGGGLDKAAATAAEMARINPAEGYSAQAKLDEKRKEYGRAEEHLRRAIEVAPQQVGRFLDMARLLTKQGRYSEADQNLAKAEQIAPDSPKVIFGRAEIYIKSKRNLNVARDLLRRYLSLELTPEDPPRSQAEKLLDQVQGI
ncbi:MAG TPA: tetratricopeptide repeat protein [Candidatus Acidoferrales bacterium]|nr:tetratricopeptide repeat protein [Candidatus Acidoferrales bacterium]